MSVDSTNGLQLRWSQIRRWPGGKHQPLWAMHLHNQKPSDSAAPTLYGSSSRMVRNAAPSDLDRWTLTTPIFDELNSAWSLSETSDLQYYVSSTRRSGQSHLDSAQDNPSLNARYIWTKLCLTYWGMWHEVMACSGYDANTQHNKASKG